MDEEKVGLDKFEKTYFVDRGEVKLNLDGQGGVPVEPEYLAFCAQLVEALRDVAAKQAEDEAIWFIPQYITEDYLQSKIRGLHRLIETRYEDEG